MGAPGGSMTSERVREVAEAMWAQIEASAAPLANPVESFDALDEYAKSRYLLLAQTALAIIAPNPEPDLIIERLVSEQHGTSFQPRSRERGTGWMAGYPVYAGGEIFRCFRVPSPPRHRGALTE